MENEVVKWITWRGKHLPIGADGKIININSYDYVDEESHGDLIDDCYDKTGRTASLIFNSVYVGKTTSVEINKALRENDKKILSVYEDDIKIMDDAINKYEMPRNVMTNRFLDLNYLKNAYNIKFDDDNKSAKAIANQMKKYIGTEMYSDSYTSVSTNESGSWYTSNLRVKMEIETKKGTHCYIPENASEQEVIFGRGQKFRLKDVKIEKKKLSNDDEYNDEEYDKVVLRYEVDKIGNKLSQKKKMLTD